MSEITYKVMENGQVMKVEHVESSIQETHYKMERATVLSESYGVVTVSIVSWEGALLNYEPVPVIITGEKVDTINLLCDDGTIELTGMSGTKIVIETRLENADNAILGVIL